MNSSVGNDTRSDNSEDSSVIKVGTDESGGRYTVSRVKDENERRKKTLHKVIQRRCMKLKV